MALLCNEVAGFEIGDGASSVAFLLWDCLHVSVNTELCRMMKNVTHIVSSAVSISFNFDATSRASRNWCKADHNTTSGANSASSIHVSLLLARPSHPDRVVLRSYEGTLR